MRTLIICAGFALALLTGPAWGGEVFGSANHMTPSCRVADPPRFEEGYCLGLVTGLASGAVKRSADLNCALDRALSRRRVLAGGEDRQATRFDPATG
jgi:hypothetical protein